MVTMKTDVPNLLRLRFCQTHGADLVSINSLAEKDFIVDTIKSVLMKNNIYTNLDIWWVGAKRKEYNIKKDIMWLDGTGRWQNFGVW